MSKRCSRCGEDKPADGFRTSKQSRDGLDWVCRVCRRLQEHERYAKNPEPKRTASQKWRERNPDKRRATAAKWNRDNYARKYAEFSMLKGPCIVCGEDFPAAIDYHHIDPSAKSFGLGTWVGRTADSIRAEIAKCICLCANCHRKFHAGHQPTVSAVAEAITRR